MQARGSRAGFGTVVLLTSALVVVACSTGGAAPSADPAIASRGASGTGTADPEAFASPSAVAEAPADAALAAYLAYTQTSVDALTSADPDVAGLNAVATEQARRHVRERVAANSDEDVVATGTLEPSATAADVEVSDTGENATVTDCVLNELAHVSADDPDEEVAESTGWRQPVVTDVEQTDDGDWKVTRVEVPLRDGSGPVPPPPEEPPYLRGPAQGNFPPSCVPEQYAEAAVAAYEAYHEAYDDAAGLGRNGPANPDSPELTAAAVDPVLSTTRAFLKELAEKGQAIRGERDQRDPWTIAMYGHDRNIAVVDCVTQAPNDVIDLDSGDSVVENDPGALRLDGADVVRANGDWVVETWTTIEKGLERCTSSEPQL